MSLKSRLKHLVSFLLHGAPKPVYANISYLSPNETLRGKKVVITGGGRGLGYSMAKKFLQLTLPTNLRWSFAGMPFALGIEMVPDEKSTLQCCGHWKL